MKNQNNKEPEKYFIGKGVVTSKSRKFLFNQIKAVIEKTPRIKCKSLNRRNVYFGKFLEATSGKRNVLSRLQSFIPAIELVQNAETYMTTSKYKGAYEFRGETGDGYLVVAHVREEVHQRKNKQLYLISCYCKLNKK